MRCDHDPNIKSVFFYVVTGPVQTTTLFCENTRVLHRFGRPSIRILKTQRLKMHLFENGSQGGEIQKRSPPVFMWTANPLTFHPAMSYNNNNNNGGLHARVRAAENIEPFLQLARLVVECESQQQFNLINSPHKQFSLHSPFSSSTCCVTFLRILSVCLQCASLMRMLHVFFSVFGECQAPPRGLEYELQRFWSFSVDPCGRKYS